MGAGPAEPSLGRLLPVRAAPYLTTLPPNLHPGSAPATLPGEVAGWSLRVESHKPLHLGWGGGRGVESCEGEVGVTFFQ